MAHGYERDRVAWALAEHTTIALHQGVIKRHCRGGLPFGFWFIKGWAPRLVSYAKELEARGRAQRSAFHHLLLLSASRVARVGGGWPGLDGLEFVDMEDAERISLQQFPRK